MYKSLEDQREEFRKRELFKQNVYLNMAEELAKLSKCVSYQVAALIIRDGRILSTGINGTPKGSSSKCQDLFEKPNNEWEDQETRERHHQWSLRNEIHAEMNALIQAAKRGHAIEGATAYVTNMPCTTCAKALVTAGIKRVVVFSDYHDTLATKFFAKAEVTIDKRSMPMREIIYDLKNYSSAR